MQYTYHEDPKRGQLIAQTYKAKGSILNPDHTTHDYSKLETLAWYMTKKFGEYAKSRVGTNESTIQCHTLTFNNDF